DLQRVLDTLVESSAQLCEASVMTRSIAHQPARLGKLAQRKDRRHPAASVTTTRRLSSNGPGPTKRINRLMGKPRKGRINVAAGGGLEHCGISMRSISASLIGRLGQALSGSRPPASPRRDHLQRLEGQCECERTV